MFVDVAGFTPMAEQLVSLMREDVKQLPSRYVADRGQAGSASDPLQIAWNKLAIADAV